MKLFRGSQKERNLKKIYAGISLRAFAIFYLIFFIGYQLQSPTTAYYSDTNTVQGAFAANPVFEVEDNALEENTESQDDEMEEHDPEKDNESSKESKYHEDLEEENENEDKPIDQSNL